MVFNKPKMIAAALFVLIGLGGCSTASSIADEPLRSGDSHIFAASYDIIKGITPASIKDTGIGITQITEDPEGTTILISQGVRAFSWGYVGRVFIEKSDGTTTTVYVNFEHRASGIGSSRYSKKLFKKMDSNLQSK